MDGLWAQIRGRQRVDEEVKCRAALYTHIRACHIASPSHSLTEDHDGRRRTRSHSARSLEVLAPLRRPSETTDPTSPARAQGSGVSGVRRRSLSVLLVYGSTTVREGGSERNCATVKTRISQQHQNKPRSICFRYAAQPRVASAPLSHEHSCERCAHRHHHYGNDDYLPSRRSACRIRQLWRRRELI